MTRRRRRSFSDSAAEDDPLALLPNLFDLAIVLAIAFLLVALGAGGLAAAVSGAKSWTVIREMEDGQTQVVTSDGATVELQTPSARQAGGKGSRLGVAYQLDDGQVIYVPD